MSVSALPPLPLGWLPPHAERVLAGLETAGYGARAVGGVVRDALLGRAAFDADIATTAIPDQVQTTLNAAGIPNVPTGIAHGTVTAVLDHRPVEITTLRADLTTDGRHAQVAFTDNWAADAARRDFTMNALYADRAGRVFDPLGGLADLHAGRVRFIGDASTRLAEDRLRALRLFRFQAWVGRAPLDPGDLAAVAAMAAELPQLSVERIWAELKKLLAAPDPRPGLDPMRASGALMAVLPEAIHGDVLARLLDLYQGAMSATHCAPAEPLLRLAALCGPSPANPNLASTFLAERLRWSGCERKRFSALQMVASDVTSPPFALWCRLGAEVLELGSWLALARDSLSSERVGALRALAERGPPPSFPLSGRDALALGIAPGPAMGEALRRVEDWWRAAEGIPDSAACRAELARRVALKP